MSHTGTDGEIVEYRRATAEDVAILVERRMAMRTEREEAPCPVDPEEFRARTLEYFRSHVPDGRFIAWLAVEAGTIVATSGMCIYDVPPTYGNCSGKVAYLVNMYTLPEYRGQGIAARLLELLVKEAVEKGCGRIALNTSKAGRPVYERFGFVDVPGEMEYFLD